MTLRALSFTEEERAFLQQRVALFWKSIFLITLLPTVARILLDPGAMMLRTGFLLDMLSAGLFGVLWLVCRTGRRSAAVILAIEWVGLATVSALLTLTGRFLTPEMSMTGEGLDGWHTLDTIPNSLRIFAKTFTVGACGNPLRFAFVF